MPFVPLDAIKLATDLIKRHSSSKWGHPKYSGHITSQEMRTLCESVLDQSQALEAFRSTINTPRTDEFFDAVRNEAAHQIERWGTEHDAGKRREDWITLLVVLVGKAAKAHWDSDVAKLKHHIVTVAAVCLNWLRAENGESSTMRPGIG